MDRGWWTGCISPCPTPRGSQPDSPAGGGVSTSRFSATVGTSYSVPPGNASAPVLATTRIETAFDPLLVSPFDPAREIDKLAASVSWLKREDVPESVDTAPVEGGFAFRLGGPETPLRQERATPGLDGGRRYCLERYTDMLHQLKAKTTSPSFSKNAEILAGSFPKKRFNFSCRAIASLNPDNFGRRAIREAEMAKSRRPWKQP